MPTDDLRDSPFRAMDRAWIGFCHSFFFTIIFCFLHPLTIHYKQVRNIIRIDSIIVYILFFTVNLFYATIH
jgi:hypothetical protein